MNNALIYNRMKKLYRTVLLWDTKDLNQNIHKNIRINIDYDYPTMIKWSPDSKAFIINKFNENTTEVYKVDRKKDGSLTSGGKAITFTKGHTEDVIALGIACNGKFIMTCSNKTDMIIWDLKGQKLAQLDTYLMNTVCAKISPCGRFIGASGFAPDAKIWEVIFTKEGDFKEAKQVFALSGHTSGIHDIAFDQDSSNMATVSKDGTWKLYDTQVEYKKGQDPRVKMSGNYSQCSTPSKIALSPNAEVVVIASSNTLEFFSGLDGTLDYTIEDVYAGHITSLMFDSAGKYLLTSGDKHIRVFHNATGYKCNIESAKWKLSQHQTSATKERLEALISESQIFLKNLEN